MKMELSFSSISSIISNDPEKLFEDSPLISIETNRLYKLCLYLFSYENSKYGEMIGDSKTARACKRYDMMRGLETIYARIIWSQFYNQLVSYGDVGNSNRDNIFPNEFVRDENVEKEFIECGRTPIQAFCLLNFLGYMLVNACSSLKYLRSLRVNINDEPPVLVYKYGDNNNYNNYSLHLDIIRNYNWCKYELKFLDTSQIITGQHLIKLYHLYQIYTDENVSIDDPVFLRRVYCVLSRYDTLSGTSSGYQMALTDTAFQWLRDNLEVTIECFGSPLNSWNERYCSIAVDTDIFFGSLGNFFLFEGIKDPMDNFVGSSFQANPPFVESIILNMAVRIEYLLDRTQGLVPYSFVIIVPAWMGCQGIELLTSSKFTRPSIRYKLILEKYQHDYRPGMQHQSSYQQQPSNIDTFVFFLQNDLGAKKWIITESLLEDFRLASAS